MDSPDTVGKMPPFRSGGRTVLALWALAIILSLYLLFRSAFFSIGSVVVHGNQYVPVEDIYQVAGISKNVNIFRLDTGNIQKRLIRDLRIAQAAVTREFPATVVITIRERQPVAYVRNSYGFVQLDREGMVLAVFKNIKQCNVPVVTGLQLGNVYVGDKVEADVLKQVLFYLAALDEHTFNQFSEVHIQSSGDVTGYTLHFIQVHLGKGDRILEKAKLTSDIFNESQDRAASIDYIDLRYATPYIKFKP